MRKRNWTPESCTQYNKIMEPYRGKTVEYKKLMEILKPVGNPSLIIKRFSEFTPSPLLIKKNKGMYLVPNYPILHEKIKNAWKYKENKQNQVVDVKSAISLLKLEGYKVLQQDFDLDAALAHPNKPVSDFIKWNEL